MLFTHWQTVNYFTFEKIKKINEESIKFFFFFLSKMSCPRTHCLLLWRLLTDFKGRIRQKRYLGVFTHPIEIIFKYEKTLKKKLHVSVVVDNADPWFSNSFWHIIWGPDNIFKIFKYCRKSRDTVPLTPGLLIRPLCPMSAPQQMQNWAIM